MAIDWLTSLGVQDQSIEGLLAKRDIDKRMNLLLNVQKEANDTSLRQQQLQENAEYRKALQEQTKTYRDQLQHEREIDNKRQRFSAVTGRLKPGDRVSDPGVHDLVTEFEGNDAFSPDTPEVGPVNPNATPSWIYRKHEAEQAQLKAEQEEERRVQVQKLADEAAKRDQARLGMENERLQQAKDRAKQAQADRERRQALLDKQLAAMPPAVRAQAAREAQVIAKGTAQGMFEGDDEYAARVHAAIQGVYERVQSDAVKRGLMPATTPVVKGRGQGAGPGPANETPEQRKARLFNQFLPSKPGG